MEEQFEFITSWDDGRKEDLKLAKLLLKYQIPAIFYIPSTTELQPSTILNLYQQGFEIGGHTNTHPGDLKKLRDSEQFAEIMSNRTFLENILSSIGDVEVTSFCYPNGKYNKITIDCLKRAGFLNARNASTLLQNLAKPDFYPPHYMHNWVSGPPRPKVFGDIPLNIKRGEKLC